jgi:hypothetical protein
MKKAAKKGTTKKAVKAPTDFGGRCRTVGDGPPVQSNIDHISQLRSYADFNNGVRSAT